MNERLNQIPGPPRRPLLGNLVEFLSNEPHELFLKYSETYGDVVVFWLGNSANILISNPEDLDKLLVSDTQDFYKDAPRVAMEPLLRDDLFIRNGNDDWGRKRQEHPFSAPDLDRQISQLLPSLGTVIHNYFLRLGQSPTGINLWASLVEMFFQIWSEGIVGNPMEKQVFRDYQLLMSTAARRLTLPLTINPVFWQSVKRWHDYFAQKVQQTYHQGNKIALLNANFCQKTDLSPEELEVQIATTFIAGVHPTATTLFSVFYLLFYHPEVNRKLRAEIGELTPDDLANLSLERLNQLSYLDRVLKETLRLYSTVPLSQRAVAPNRYVTLGNYQIPGGTPVWFSSWAVHRNPKYWSDPLEFIPDRFENPPPAHHFFPFGIGSRSCIGQPWAIAMLKLTIAVVLAKFEVKIDPDYTYETKFGPALFVPKKRLKAWIVDLEAPP